MVEIKNKTGKVVQRSQNLRGLREWSGKYSATLVEIWPVWDSKALKVDPSKPRSFIGCDGRMRVTFWNGTVCECDWASFTVLCESLIRWRNLYGVPLKVNGKDAETVQYRNVELNRHSR